MYPQDMVIPMQAELTTAGFKIYILLKSRKRNKSRRNNTSSCELCMWLCSKKSREQNEFRRAKKPDHLITVFAGVR
jgi:hypothetical protein